jgi:ribosomal protein S18 acetylase RimI-like enzyme
MVVHPDYQRQGLGAFMVQYVKVKTAEQGCRSITLGTDTSMSAFQLYRKYGFEILADIQE